MAKTDIGSLSLRELESYIVSIGESRFRAKQIYEWLCRGVDFDGMSNLSKTLREKLAAECYSGIPEIERKLVSAVDGTVKYLFRFPDGECVESVVMYYKHGTTICISSQVGCRMGCRFCASTIGGKVRDLAPSEMLGQIVRAQRDIGERIDGIVMMGIGEPLDNYDNTVKFLKLVTSPDGLNIGARHISVSTSGLVPRIKELEKEDFQITLSISLHASNDERRSALMPVNRKWGIDELLGAVKHYFDATGRRVSIEYTLIAAQNDSEADAKELCALLRRYFTRADALHVNLIPVNPVRESGFSKGDRRSIEQFQKILTDAGFAATIRRTLGPDINASCGQLRRGQSPESAAKDGE
ncbi:MAG: 23S rRNA (adenine(2503)-C(2))-methyltransferase RlmN [Clostridia bacterium]|nr:23S rRNA (adenine(2503)-C(2))-methyltransferase RlmN [Clostridia bacterium]